MENVNLDMYIKYGTDVPSIRISTNVDSKLIRHRQTNEWIINKKLKISE